MKVEEDRLEIVESTRVQGKHWKVPKGTYFGALLPTE